MADYGEIEACLKRMYLTEVMQDVMKTLVGMEFFEQRTYETLDDKFILPHVSGCLYLNGEKGILVMLSMPIPVANIIISTMSGTPSAKLKEEILCDGIMELSNIISGKIKTLLARGNLPYLLSPPFVIHGGEYSVRFKKNQKGLSCKYKAGLAEINLRILFL